MCLPNILVSAAIYVSYQKTKLFLVVFFSFFLVFFHLHQSSKKSWLCPCYFSTLSLSCCSLTLVVALLAGDVWPLFPNNLINILCLSPVCLGWISRNEEKTSCRFFGNSFFSFSYPMKKISTCNISISFG